MCVYIYIYMLSAGTVATVAAEAAISPYCPDKSVSLLVVGFDKQRLATPHQGRARSAHSEAPAASSHCRSHPLLSKPARRSKARSCKDFRSCTFSEGLGFHS